MNRNSTHQLLRNALGGGFYVAINLNIVKITGSYEASALLTRAIYWQEIKGGEFYKTNDEWMEELGLSEWALRTAKEKISKFITITRRGIPAKNYYLVDMEKVAEELAKINNSEKRTESEQEMTNCQNKMRENHSTSSEDSTEQEARIPQNYNIQMIHTNDTYKVKNKQKETEVPLRKDSQPQNQGNEIVKIETKKPQLSNIDEQAVRISDGLDEIIFRRLPNRRKTRTAQQRANSAIEIERMNRIDGFSYDDIIAILKFSQSDEFWKNNILSTKKLRKHGIQLALKMRAEIERQQNAIIDITK